MKLVIDISKERYDEIMAMDWKNCRRIFDEEIRAIHDGKALEQEPVMPVMYYPQVEGITPTVVEPCTDAISRQAMHIELEKWITYGEYKYSNATKYLYDRIDRLSPVTPAKKVGRWIAKGLVDSNDNRIYECSECHHSDTQAATMIVPYCWYCGAKMQEVKV